jgi:uncharacterized repeat protein (TIGR03803 family)
LFYFQEFDTGYYPNGGLVRDRAGTIFGTTQGAAGGSSQSGAFKLDTKGKLTYMSPLLGVPYAGLIRDSAGSLYGTTAYYPFGSVFKLDVYGNLTTLYSFTGGADGAYPVASVVMDSAGNLYGTTAYGGTVNAACPAGCGVVFKITP